MVSHGFYSKLMQITKEFLLSEIKELEQESNKAQTFQIQAQATISAYKMLINKLNAPEEQIEEQPGE